MERGVLKSAALAAFVSLSVTSAEPPASPGEAGNADPLLDMIKRPAPSEVVAILAWGERTMFTNIQRQTSFIRRVATEAERRLAEQRAAAYYATLSQAEKKEIKKKKRYWAVPITKAKPPTKPAKPPEKPEATPQPRAETEEFMIYDPLSGTLANKYVYTVTDMPPRDTAMSVDGYEPLLFVGRY